MKRIMPEEVEFAYRTRGVTPFRGHWERCGLGVLMPKGWWSIGETIEDTVDKVAQTLGLSSAYVTGFVYGFDGRTILPNGDDMEEGYRDGQLVATAVFGGLLDPVEPEAVPV